MANCTICGRPVAAPATVHPECQARVEAERGERVPGGVILCNVAGFLCLVLGLYFLVIEPGNPVADALPDSVAGIRVVNFQRLAMGQAFTIAGAIFLAAAWRPRG